MACCTSIDHTAPEPGFASISADDIRAESRDLANGLRQITLSAPAIHCGACIGTIEGALARLPQVASSRVNLTARRVTIDWREDATDRSLAEIVTVLARAGYAVHTETAETGDDPELRRLLRALGVAGFSAMNIMLLSVSVWSGAEGATRDLFHWISAIIAGPTILYSGRVFYASAFAALSARRLNMDVPIALAITLAFAMSLWQVTNSAEHAWFDAPVSLLFFLLAGRTADHMMRSRARSRVSGLGRMMAKGAVVIEDDGTRRYMAIEGIRPGMLIAVPAGERVPVDGVVVSGRSDVDRSLVTGESAAEGITQGRALEAGVLNLTGPLTLRATADAKSSFLAAMESMVVDASAANGAYRRIADRAAQLYSPVVHLTALASLIGWKLVGADWNFALQVTVATLIITCPCALGLAVPMVHAVAAGRLSKAGVLLKDAAALEKLATVDTIVFDKTGTLTTGTPQMTGCTGEPAALAIAAMLARNSNHPYARGVAQALAFTLDEALTDMREVPGSGVEARSADGALWRFGASVWACGTTQPSRPPSRGEAAVVLSRNGVLAATFRFTERLRKGAAATAEAAARDGMRLRIASGDAETRVAQIAGQLGIEAFHGGLKPAEKIALIQREKAAGHRVLMVGDGINDAPALAAADVSMAPATASEIGRAASGFVFLHEDLSSVTDAIGVAKKAHRLVLQNFALAIGYNIIAVPLAVLGHASPLLAAIAMSTSSIIVVANAMRLAAHKSPEKPVQAGKPAARPTHLERAAA
jgi:Cu2+-exporting ATPase